MNDETFLLGGHWFLRTQFKELPLGFDEKKISICNNIILKWNLLTQQHTSQEN
jgi:hypothetical protein